MNLIMNVGQGQATCRLLCRCAQSTLATSCVCWIVPIVKTCESGEELLTFRVWSAPYQGLRL